jgi:hypothetical protein
MFEIHSIFGAMIKSLSTVLASVLLFKMKELNEL